MYVTEQINWQHQPMCQWPSTLFNFNASIQINGGVCKLRNLSDNASMPTDQHQFSTLVSQRQNDICNALSAVDDTLFLEDSWDRPGGGGGITRILESPTFEKAGVNTSQVFGAISKTETPMFTTLINKVAPHISNLNNSDFLPQELVW